MSFELTHLWAQMGLIPKLIIILLFIMGILSLYVGLERWVTFGKARTQSRLLGGVLTDHLSTGDLDKALSATKDTAYKSAYLGHMLEVALGEIQERRAIDRPGLDAARRAMDRRSVRESADLRRGMNILATVGSTAPFVGLVGTIFGIINAFQAMAETGSGGLAAVSAGIAEALVATAIGIAVAILGVWLYNYFTARVDAIVNDITVSIEEFMDWGEKQLLAMTEEEFMDWGEKQLLAMTEGEEAPTVEAPAK